MATGLPSGSVFNANVDFNTIFNLGLSTKQATFDDVSDTAGGALPAGNVRGFLWIVDGSGDTVYANAAFDTVSPVYTSPDITRVNTDTTGLNTTIIPLPLDSDGNVVRDTYTVYYLIQSVVTPTILIYKSVQLVYGYVAPTQNISTDINIYTPTITFTDNSNYTIQNVANTNTAPTTSRAWTFYYPQTSGVPNVTNAASVWTIGTVYSGTSMVKLITTNTYSIGSTDVDCGFSIIDILTIESEVVVKDNGLCELYECVKKLFSQAEASRQTSSPQYQVLLGKIYTVTAYRQQINEAVKCGNYSDVAGYIATLEGLLDCQCGCDNDTPRLLTGISQLISGSRKRTDTLLATNNYTWSELRGLVYDTTGTGQADFTVFIDGQELSSTFATITFDTLTGEINWGVTVPAGTLITIQKLPYIS